VSPEEVLAALERAVDAGLAQQDIAAAAGFAHPRLSDFRAGRSIGKPEVRLPALAKALGKLGFPVAEDGGEP